ncbi:MAG: ComEA family DNA-binding protein [Actinomycetota bacterium]
MDRSWVAAVAVGIAGIAGVFLLWPAASAAPRVEIATPRTTAGIVTVHVSGSVTAPGLVSLPAGARIADAVVAAGGALPGADLSSLNLAAPITDGQQLVVPAASAPGDGSAPSDGRVRINTADVASLEVLPGVGPVLAGRIVAYRDAHGPFGTIEDLLEVPGIGESKLAAMRESVIVP